MSQIMKRLRIKKQVMDQMLILSTLYLQLEIQEIIGLNIKSPRTIFTSKTSATKATMLTPFEKDHSPSIAPKSPIRPCIPLIWFVSLDRKISFRTEPWLLSDSITDTSSATFCLAACSRGIRYSCSLMHSCLITRTQSSTRLSYKTTCKQRQSMKHIWQAQPICYLLAPLYEH